MIFRFREDGGEIGGSGVHFPSTPVKYLADMRSRVNTQQYSSIYEDQRPCLLYTSDAADDWLVV